MAFHIPCYQKQVSLVNKGNSSAIQSESAWKQNSYNRASSIRIFKKNTTFAYGFGGVIDTQKILEGHSREKLLNHDPKASDVQTSSNSTACKTGESK